MTRPGRESGTVPLHRSLSTSSDLLEQVKTQNREAWQRFVDLYAPLVNRWCRRTGVRADDAPDIVQDVFLAVATHIDGFHYDRPSDSLRGWLWTITRTKVCDHVRRRKHRVIARGGSSAAEQLRSIPDRLPSVADAHAGSGADAAMARRVVELIRPEVQDRTWRAFWQLAIDGQSGPSVAAELGMSLHAVHQSKYRVLRRLRAKLHNLLP